MYTLVAGGAGFLGSFLCDRLLENGHQVLCVDNLLTGNKSNIEKNFKNSNFNFLKHDIINPLVDNIAFNLKTIDAIYHLASPASPNIRSPMSYMQHPVETMLSNSLGTYHLLELAKKFKAKFVYASSSEIYGEPIEHPQNEKNFGNVNPIGPRSCYDEGKRFGEAIVSTYVRNFDVDARIVRIFNTYGPRMDKNDGRVVSNFIVSALTKKPLTIYGDGSQTRSFCYVSDLIEGLIKVLEKDEIKGEVFNLGNDLEFRIIELAKQIGKLLGVELSITYEPLPIDDPKRRRPDLTKSRQILHFEPKVDLAEGLKKTIEYFTNKI